MNSQHKATERTARPVDLPLLVVTLLLVAFGLVMVFSSSAFFAQKHVGSQYYFFWRQAAFAGVGLLLMWAISHYDYQKFKTKTVVYTLYMAVVALLVAVFIPGLGYKALGATRWLSIAGFRFQPSELAKLALIVYMAYSLTRQRERNSGMWHGFLIHLIVPSVALILILKGPDIGTFVLMLAVLMGMMFVAGARLRYPLGLAVFVAPVSMFILKVFEHGEQRIEMWKKQLLFLGSEMDYSLLCYQIRESIISVGSGRLFGKGLGDGTLKIFFLPQAHSDFILATLGQELGFIGIVLLFAGFGFLIVRSFQISTRVPDSFGCFLATGIATLLMLQFLINAGVVFGLLPPKGIALPLISYGGTSLIVTLISIGILMNISRSATVSSNVRGGR